eukprot:PhM_4_TR14722/c1_g1_i1/m.12440
MGLCRGVAVDRGLIGGGHNIRHATVLSTHLIKVIRGLELGRAVAIVTVTVALENVERPTVGHWGRRGGLGWCLRCGLSGGLRRTLGRGLGALQGTGSDQVLRDAATAVCLEEVIELRTACTGSTRAAGVLECREELFAAGTARGQRGANGAAGLQQLLRADAAHKELAIGVLEGTGVACRQSESVRALGNDHEHRLERWVALVQRDTVAVGRAALTQGGQLEHIDGVPTTLLQTCLVFGKRVVELLHAAVAHAAERVRDEVPAGVQNGLAGGDVGDQRCQRAALTAALIDESLHNLRCAGTIAWRPLRTRGLRARRVRAIAIAVTIVTVIARRLGTRG